MRSETNYRQTARRVNAGVLINARESSVTNQHPALLAVFLFEDVILSGGDEGEVFGGLADRPLVQVEAVHQVKGDGLCGIEGLHLGHCFWCR